MDNTAKYEKFISNLKSMHGGSIPSEKIGFAGIARSAVVNLGVISNNGDGTYNVDRRCLNYLTGEKVKDTISKFIAGAKKRRAPKETALSAPISDVSREDNNIAARLGNLERFLHRVVYKEEAPIVPKHLKKVAVDALKEVEWLFYTALSEGKIVA